MVCEDRTSIILLPTRDRRCVQRQRQFCLVPFRHLPSSVLSRLPIYPNRQQPSPVRSHGSCILRPTTSPQLTMRGMGLTLVTWIGFPSSKEKPSYLTEADCPINFAVHVYRTSLAIEPISLTVSWAYRCSFDGGGKLNLARIVMTTCIPNVPGHARPMLPGANI